MNIMLYVLHTKLHALNEMTMAFRISSVNIFKVNISIELSRK